MSAVKVIQHTVSFLRLGTKKEHFGSGMNQDALFVEKSSFYFFLQPIRLKMILKEIILFVLSYLLHLPSINHGGVYTYHLGERLNGIQKVSGSIPLISTKRPATQVAGLFCLSAFRKHHKNRVQKLSHLPTICIRPKMLQ